MRDILRVLKPLIVKLPMLAELYRYKRDHQKLAREVTFKEPLGFKFNGPDSMENGTFEPDETSIFEGLIDHFDLFINIGANTGYYVLKRLIVVKIP